MKITNHLLLNTAFQLIGRLVSSGIFFLATLLMARSFAPELFGEYFKVMTLLTGAMLFVDFGLNPVYLHMTSEKKVTGYFSLIAIRIIGAGSMYFGISLLLIIGVSVGVLAADSYFLKGVFIGGWSLLFGAVTLSATAAFQYTKRWNLVAFAQILGTIITLVGVWVSVSFYANSQALMFRGSMIAYTIGSLATAATSLFFLVRTEKTKSFRLIERSKVGKLVHRAMPLGLMMLVNGLYLRNGAVALSLNRSSAAVGEYGLAYKFFELALVLPAFLMNSYYPDLLEKKLGVTSQELTLMFKTLAKLSLVIVFILWTGAPLLMWVRADFVSSVLLLRLFALIVPLFFLSAPLMWLYVLKNQQKKLLLIYFVAFLFNLGSTRVLVPMYGAPGAIAGIGVSELLVLLLGSLVYYKKYGKT